MAPYLNKTDAAARLSSRYAITATLTDGDMDAASSELDNDWGPFYSQKKDDAQERAFPRGANLDGTDNTAGTVPDAVLDAVALLAYHVSSDEGLAVTSESVLDRSMTYATPKTSQTLLRVQSLLRPYQLKVGSRL